MNAVYSNPRGFSKRISVNSTTSPEDVKSCLKISIKTTAKTMNPIIVNMLKVKRIITVKISGR